MKEMMKTLEEKAVFVRQLQSSEIPYHSQYLISSAQPMTDAINKYIPNPKLRSRKWISTSVMNTDHQDQSLKYASGEYFVYNLMNPVNFYDKLKELPTDAVVLEIGPHSLFQKVVTETLDNSSYVSLIKKDSNDTNLDMFLSGLATLYELGYNLSIDKLYPRVEWPVPRGTPSIGSLIKWDHSRQFDERLYPLKYCRATSSDTHMTVNVALNKSDTFYLDHAIDGNALFPATGYLMLAWRKLAATLGKVWYQVPVVFENVQLKRAVFITEAAKTMLTVKYYPITGILQYNLLIITNLLTYYN
jgi:fatty acid synthase